MSEETYKGYTIRIETDSYPLNPRTEWDNLGIMACSHRRYDMGDKEHIVNFKNHKGWDSVTAWLLKNRAVAVLPIYMYDHSGQTINTTGFNSIDSPRWDWGQLGVIYTAMEKLHEVGHTWKKMNSQRRAKVKEWLLDEVRIYDHYLTGEVYVFTIVNQDDEEEYSCGGFYGSDHKASGLLESAREVINSNIEYRLKFEGIQEELPLETLTT